jgi:N-acetylglucosamine-6-phosphate deacetylase
MDRPNLQDTMKQAQAMMAEIDKLLGKAQEMSSRSRFAVTIATEMNGANNSFDQIVKSQIYTEAMGHTFARIIEARTHLDVALRALTENPNKDK